MWLNLCSSRIFKTPIYQYQISAAAYWFIKWVSLFHIKTTMPRKWIIQDWWCSLMMSSTYLYFLSFYHAYLLIEVTFSHIHRMVPTTVTTHQIRRVKKDKDKIFMLANFLPFNQEKNEIGNPPVDFHLHLICHKYVTYVAFLFIISWKPRKPLIWVLCLPKETFDSGIKE